MGPWDANETAVINLQGGAVTNTANVGVYLGYAGNTAGILNLNAGLLQASIVTGYNGPSYGVVAGGQLNFNGGTLRAGTNSANLINVSGTAIYGGGATLDNNGYTVTIGQPLLAPAGNGVQGILSFTGGSGYIAPPLIVITNAASDTTGFGATAIAQIDRAAGTVTNIVITSPGQNYTATPIFVVSGGGAVTSATVTGLTPTANTGGGLISTGAGTNVLTAANTYTGNTTVSGGTLELAQATIATNSTVTIASGAQLKLDFSTTNRVAALVLNGVTQSPGVYNATTTPASFAGTGSLVVPSPGPGTFSSTPVITSFTMVNGSNIALACLNGQANDAYYLLASTIVALPLNQWRTVATNILSANGSFTFNGTNVVTAGNQQQFYILSSTNYNH